VPSSCHPEHPSFVILSASEGSAACHAKPLTVTHNVGSYLSYCCVNYLTLNLGRATQTNIQANSTLNTERVFVARQAQSQWMKKMELQGIGLGMMVALLWGSSDILASLAARRLRSFKTTFVSQLIGLFVLLIFGTIIYWRWHLPLNLMTLALSALIGAFSGLCAALGYMALYRALEIGPISIVSPLTATSSTFTLILAVLVLQEHLTFGRMGFVMLVILGLVLASTSLVELRTLLKKPGSSLWSQGVRWAFVATLAFGAMDFGIGASASLSDWFMPVLWTRIFSIFFLFLASEWKRRQRISRAQMASNPVSSGRTLSLSLPSLEEFSHIRSPFSTLGLGILLALLAGMVECVAVLAFSIDTRIATTGIASAITSSYALVVMLFGLIVYRERLATNQLFGIGVFMVGLILLSL
jgi:drug/metabolite transporter (DMT)-like permease